MKKNKDFAIFCSENKVTEEAKRFFAILKVLGLEITTGELEDILKKMLKELPKELGEKKPIKSWAYPPFKKENWPAMRMYEIKKRM